MKKFILITTFIFSSNFANAGVKDTLENSLTVRAVASVPVAAAFPVMTFALTPVMTFTTLNIGGKYQDYDGVRKSNEVPLFDYPTCPLVEQVYLDADKTDIYYGEEKFGESDLQNVDNIKSILPKINKPYESYICVNPKPSKIYPNGCLDTLKQKSIKKATGKWYIKKAFSYSNIEYVQLAKKLNNGKEITGFTDVLSALEYSYYKGTKVLIADKSLHTPNFSLKYSVLNNCKNIK